MPANDGVSELPIPVPGEGDTPEENEPMNDLSPNVANQLLTQMVGLMQQTGQVAQNNFVTIQKIVDYDYLENKRMVTLDEAIGVREVTGPLPVGTK